MKNIRVNLDKKHYPSHPDWTEINKELIHETYTSKMYQSLNFNYHTIQSLWFKINYNKLLTLENIQNNPVLTHLKTKMPEDFIWCPACLNSSESVKHFLSCIKYKEIETHLIPQMKDIINTAIKYEQSEYGKTIQTIQTFPVFYSTNLTTKENQLTPATNILKNTNPWIALYGNIPNDLVNALRETGLSSHSVKVVAHKMMLALAKNIYERWKARLKFLKEFK